MNEFINNHPYLTGGIIFLACKTLVKVVRIIKQEPQPSLCIIHVTKEATGVKEIMNEGKPKEESAEE